MAKSGVAPSPLSTQIVTSSGIYDAIIDTNDPRGIRIYCEKRTWEEHIVARKPTMLGIEKEVENALRQPTAVLKDADFDDRECYYQLCGKRYLKVVTKIIAPKERAVITAFFVDAPKSKETLLWKS